MKAQNDTIWRITLGLLLIFFLTMSQTSFADDFDPVAEIQAKLKKAQEEKQKTDDAIAIIKPKIKELETQLAAMEETKTQLERMKDKMRAIRAWNLFATVMGGTMDVIQKVNPGSSAVVALCDFLQDRLEDKLKDQDKKNRIVMKVRQINDTAKNMSPKLRMLERTLQMTPQQVADELFARGRVDNDWVQGWNRTPDVVAQSDTVVVAKIEFIIEAIGPALQEVTAMITGIRDLLNELYGQLAFLESESKRLAEEIHDWERQLEIQGVYKERQNLPSGPPPNTINPYTTSSKDYGTAAGEIQKAWGELKAGTIGGDTYNATVRAAEVGASQKMWEILRPYSDAYGRAWNALWTCSGNDNCHAAWRALTAASNAYSAASNREWAAYQAAIPKTLESIKKDAQAEAEKYMRFEEKYVRWINTPITIRYNYWNIEEQSRDYPLSQAGYTGDGLAMAVWAGNGAIGRILSGGLYGYYYPVGPVRGIQERYRNWEAGMKKQEQTIREIAANMKSSDNSASGIAAQSTGLADELERNIEIWHYVRPWASVRWWENLRELYGRLKLYHKEYQIFSKTASAKAEASQKQAEDLSNTAAKASSVTSSEKIVLDAAAKYIEGKKQVYQTSRGDLDPSGTSLRRFLKNWGGTGTGPSETGNKTLKAFLDSLSSVEALEKHALTRIPGEPTYDPKFKPPLTKDLIEMMLTNYRRLAGSISAARDAYGDAYRTMNQADQALDANLKTMRSGFAESMPAQVPQLAKGLIIEQESQNIPWEQRYYLTSWAPSNPDDFGDSTYGLQKVIDEYRELSQKYYDIVNPVLARVKAEHRREAKLIEELTKKIDRSWMSLDEATYHSKMWESMKEIYAIYGPIYSAGEAKKGSPVDKAYGAFQSLYNSINGEYQRKIAVRRAGESLNGHLADVKKFLANPDQSGGSPQAESWIKTLQADQTSYDALKSEAAVGSALTEMKGIQEKLNAYIAACARRMAEAEQKKASASVALVKDLYTRFKEAYEERNDSRVISMISDGWQAGDGTTLSDLQATLRRTFKTFDEIRYNIQNLSITPGQDGRYIVSYDVTITSRIYKRNLKHEEKSSINEEVTIEKSGKAKISRTLGGRFWYVQ
jgi:hypothetical protein